MFPDTETLTALDLKGNTWCLKVEGNINNIFSSGKKECVVMLELRSC